MSYRAERYTEAMTILRYVRAGAKEDIASMAKDLLYGNISDIPAIAKRLDMVNQIVKDAECEVATQENLLTASDRAELGLEDIEEDLGDVDEV